MCYYEDEFRSIYPELWDILDNLGTGPWYESFDDDYNW